MKTFRENIIEALEIGLDSHKNLLGRAILNPMLEAQFEREISSFKEMICRLKANDPVPVDDHDPRKYCPYPFPDFNGSDEL